MTDQRPERPSEHATDHPADPGAYVGREPERQAETIPGGVRDDDERIAAHSTQRSPVHEDADAPERREAGQDR